MPRASLEDKLARFESPMQMLREAPTRRFKNPYPDQYTNWQQEQSAWREGAVLFDQSHHMTDVYFRGPDVQRLLSHTGTNSFATFGRNRAKHFVACNPDGDMIGTAVLFGLEDDEVSLVGPAAAANWVQFQAEKGGYDVEVVRDERTTDNDGKRLTFRLEIEGPTTWEILNRAHGGKVDNPGFFRMNELTLDGVPVRGLVHTMVADPRSESMGLEIWGPQEESSRCFEALLRAGDGLGLVRGGALAYYTGSVETGYMAQPTAAVYTGEAMREYRRWLPADSYEGTLSIGGSFRPESIEDYYINPYDFGYGRLVKFDHEFIGREALHKMASEPHRKKVWLVWNEDDVARVYASSLFDGDARAKYLETPLARYARVQADSVLNEDALVGMSTMAGYTVTARAWMSVAMVDSEHAIDGKELTLVWGEEHGGTAKQAVEQHTQIEIRTTVHTSSPGV